MRSLLSKTLAALACALATATAFAADDFSPAERAIFMTPQLAGLKPPTTLRYQFSKAGSLEPGFEDKVTLRLTARPDKKCCAAAAEFLTGARKLALPEVDAAEANPVVMYFLERDIREMNRLTKGQAAYFRKRIRMAIYQGAEIREMTLPYAGKTVPARQITVSPYADDPMRPRFENLATKRYVFTLSEAVPGGVYALAAEVDGPTADTPVLRETLLLDGATAVPRQP